MVGQLAPNLRLLALPGAGHPATQIFTEAKTYATFQEAVFEKAAGLAQIKQLHRVSRLKAPRYQSLLENYALRRSIASSSPEATTAPTSLPTGGSVDPLP